MLKIYYSKINGIDDSDFSSLSQYRFKKLSAMSDPLHRKQSAAAEMLLIKALGYIPEIDEDREGKPFIVGSDIEYNVSHSGDYAVCAISDASVGADVETKRAYYPAVAKRCFTDDELEFIAQSEDKAAAFRSVWCRKESYVKNLGVGIKLGMKSFSVFDMPEGYSFFEYSCDEFSLAVCSKGNAEPDIFEYIELP